VELSFQTRCQRCANSEQKRKQENMKQQTTSALAICSSFVLAVAMTVAVAIWSPVQAQKVEPAAGEMKMDGKVMEGCEAMQARKKAMMEDMKAQDAELAEQTAAMNSAPQDKKVDLMAAVITKMVEQRIAMDARMAKMQEEMMPHMMRHMQMDKESMAQCPMMKDMSEESAGTHEGHRDEQK
jgi:hypothetical protein